MAGAVGTYHPSAGVDSMEMLEFRAVREANAMEPIRFRSQIRDWATWT
jgi:hypothetical protein